jgi:hypothetical protein
MTVSRSGLLWIYNCPATNIAAAKAIANIALANWLTSFIPPHRNRLIRPVQRTLVRHIKFLVVTAGEPKSSLTGQTQYRGGLLVVTLHAYRRAVAAAAAFSLVGPR